MLASTVASASDVDDALPLVGAVIDGLVANTTLPVPVELVNVGACAALPVPVDVTNCGVAVVLADTNAVVLAALWYSICPIVPPAMPAAYPSILVIPVKLWLALPRLNVMLVVPKLNDGISPAANVPQLGAAPLVPLPVCVRKFLVAVTFGLSKVVVLAAL